MSSVPHIFHIHSFAYDSRCQYLCIYPSSPLMHQYLPQKSYKTSLQYPLLLSLWETCSILPLCIHVQQAYHRIRPITALHFLDIYTLNIILFFRIDYLPLHNIPLPDSDCYCLFYLFLRLHKLIPFNTDCSGCILLHVNFPHHFQFQKMVRYA